MTSRFSPYATTPARLTAQLLSDLLIAAWITVWVLVGMAVHHAIATFARVGTQVQEGATGIADNLNSAGNNADRLPLVGDAVATPLRAASEAASSRLPGACAARRAAQAAGESWRSTCAPLRRRAAGGATPVKALGAMAAPAA
jgi:hypothetical protein